MKLAKIVLSVLAIAALPVMGCGGDDTEDPGDQIDAGEDPGDEVDANEGGGDEVDPSGDHFTYVADLVSLPANDAEANSFGFDLNGDGQPDNKLGKALATAETVGMLGLQTLLDEQLAIGSFILLADVQATSLDTATGVGFRVFLGENANPEPCPGGDTSDPDACGLHLQGGATFDVSPDSPDALVVGTITGGQLEAGPGTVSLVVNLSSGAPLTLDLIQAQVAASVSADGIMSGKIGGAVTEEDRNEDIYPALQSFINDIVMRDCALEGDTCTCDAGTTGEDLAISGGILDFDANDDCMVTVEEVAQNGLVSTALAPDVDLLDANGQPGTDGVNDSISVGIGFNAVTADFTPEL